MSSRSKKLPGPWRHIHPKVLEYYINIFKQWVRQRTSGEWDEQQLYYVAKAIALYYLMIKKLPEIHDMKYGVLLVGEGGQIHVLKKPIKYKGPFTRGYRYIRVDVPAGTYRIIKIKRKRVRRKNS